MKFGEENSGGGDFQPCPEGRQFVRLRDVIDMGYNETFFEGRSTGYAGHVKFIWETKADESGEQFLIFDRKLKISSHEKAAMRKMMDAWLGKKFVETECAGKEWEDLLVGLIGRPAVVQIEHRDWEGKTFANVASIAPYDPRYDPAIDEVTTYIRRCKREDWPEKRPAISAYTSHADARQMMAGEPAQAHRGGHEHQAEWHETPPPPRNDAPPPGALVDDAPPSAPPVNAQNVKINKLMKRAEDLGLTVGKPKRDGAAAWILSVEAQIAAAEKSANDEDPFADE